MSDGPDLAAARNAWVWYERALFCAGILLAILGLRFWWTLIRHETPAWRADGIVVERFTSINPLRADVTFVAAGHESFPWAYAPYNHGNGDCHDPHFKIEGMPERNRIYQDGDHLSIRIHYLAPGCKELRAGFGGRHVKGSPWYEHWCGERSSLTVEKVVVCKDSISSNVRGSNVALTGFEGTIEVAAQPGVFPPLDVGSVPNLAGLELCSLQLAVNDGPADESGRSQQINLDCPDWK